MLRSLCKIILRLTGWKAIGKFPVTLKKAVLIVAPHTSGWDVIIGVLFRKALHLEKFKFLGKQELFKPPFGFIFKWLGGVPVDRFHRNNLVDQVVDLFDKREEFFIALSPEGTRKKVDRLRTGFYFIAKKAAVPIVMIGLDYGKKELIFADAFYPGNDEELDFKKIVHFFGPLKGKHPGLGLGHMV